MITLWSLAAPAFVTMTSPGADGIAEWSLWLYLHSIEWEGKAVRFDFYHYCCCYCCYYYYFSFFFLVVIAFDIISSTFFFINQFIHLFICIYSFIYSYVHLNAHVMHSWHSCVHQRILLITETDLELISLHGFLLPLSCIYFTNHSLILCCLIINLLFFFFFSYH